MDDRNDGFFNSFFGGDFDKHFKDAMGDMDEMFKRLGDFHIDFRPPPVNVGGKVAGYNESPRDMMLKSDGGNEGESSHTTGGSTQPRAFHPGFRPPFNRNDQDITDNVSVFTGPNAGNINLQITSKSTSFRQNPDGSVEKIVKTLENGRSCTTVTKTDKDGNTTTTTTCDRPGDIVSVRDVPASFMKSPSIPPPVPRQNMDGPRQNMDGLTDDDKSIFNRYFKDWFKPKDL